MSHPAIVAMEMRLDFDPLPVLTLQPAAAQKAPRQSSRLCGRALSGCTGLQGPRDWPSVPSVRLPQEKPHQAPQSWPPLVLAPPGPQSIGASAGTSIAGCGRSVNVICFYQTLHVCIELCHAHHLMHHCRGRKIFSDITMSLARQAA